MLRAFLCSVISLALVSIASAQERTTEGHTGTRVKGTIEKVDPTNHTITVMTSDGTTKEFKITDQTRMMMSRHGMRHGEQGNEQGGYSDRSREGAYGRDRSREDTNAPSGTMSGQHLRFDDLKEGEHVTLLLSEESGSSGMPVVRQLWCDKSSSESHGR